MGFLVNRFTANLPVKKFLKSVKNWQNHDHESVAPFLAHPVVCFVCCLHLSLHSESKIYLCNNFVRAMPIFRILSLLSSGIIYAHYSWIDSHDTSAMLSPLFFLYIWPVTVNLAFQKWICNEVENNICSCCVNTLQIHKKIIRIYWCMMTLCKQHLMHFLDI